MGRECARARVRAAVSRRARQGLRCASCAAKPSAKYLPCTVRGGNESRAGKGGEEMEEVLLTINK